MTSAAQKPVRKSAHGPAASGETDVAACEASVPSAPWLAIIGIGEDGVEGLTPAARRRLSAATAVFGGDRHLRLAHALITGQAVPWPRPIRDAVPAIEARRGEPTAVLVSGDPFHHGMGSVLAETVSPSEYETFPAPSAFTLAASRLGWAVQDAETVSLCGYPVEQVIPSLQPGRRLLILSADETTPRAVADLLTSRGLGASVLHVLEGIGGANEKIRHCQASEFDLEAIGRLNVIGLTVSGGAEALVLSKAAGLDDSLFANDGMLTKREIRAVTLSSLAPRAGELLWDVGAGSGSIGIEWLLAHHANRAIAIERDRSRVATIDRNKATLGVSHLQVVHGVAPEILQDLPRPDAVFVGGGLSGTGVLQAAWAALGSGGRLVANGVTLESEAVLNAAFQEFGGTMIRLSVERLGPLGGMHGYRPAMTVTQYRVVKP